MAAKHWVHEMIDIESLIQTKQVKNEYDAVFKKLHDLGPEGREFAGVVTLDNNKYLILKQES